MGRKRLEITGKIGLDSESGYLQLIESRSDFISTLFQRHFFPEYKPSWDMHLDALNRLLSFDTSSDSAHVRKTVEELDHIMIDYSNRFHIVFEPLENQGMSLVLMGKLFLSGKEISFESPSTSGFLEKIFLDHYYPGQFDEVDDAEDYQPADAGVFRLTFELVENEPESKLSL